MTPINPLGLFGFLQGEWDKTSQPLKERASILPLGQYEDGSVGLAWPGILAAPAEGVANFGTYGYGEEAVPYNTRMAFDAAGGAMTGGLGVGLAGGLADNAVGSAGGKLALNALERAGADLPMDLASRMARAREMGFDTDTVWYHGTDRPGFTEFSRDQVGSRYAQDDAGFFFMDKPRRVEGYAGDRASATGEMVGAIYPTHIRPGKQFVLDETSALNPQMLDDLQQLGPMAVWDIWHPHLKEAAQGADSILVRGADEQMMVAMDPRNIRSVNAAFDPAKSDSANLLAANAKTGAAVPLAIDAAERQAPQGIRAYHGSPHDFDKFSLDAIGTGEGAQAYGHGLYFAEAEDVARGYREKLGMGNSPGNYAAMDQAKEALEFAKGDKQAALKRIDDIFADSPRDRRHAELSKQYVMEPPGRMYEVNIRANPSDFLDFDAPISAQPAIRDRLAPFGLPDDAKGHGLYNALVDRLFADGRLEPGTDLSVQVSRALRDSGIPGVKYLDGMSRQAGEGSRNYVVTDDAIIDIVRKYANAPTGSSVPLALNALERAGAQPQGVSGNLTNALREQLLALDALPQTSARSGVRVDTSIPGREVRDIDGAVRVTLKDYPVEENARLVDELRTREDARGQGLARRAMEDVTREADASRSPLYLNVAPGDGVDPQRLTEFYRSLGFESLGPSYMRRSPVYSNAPTGSSVPLGMEAQDDPALIEYLRHYGLIQ